MPAKQTVRRSVAMTLQLHARLRQLADRQPRPVSEAALIRRAIREYLDRQEDITGSRAHVLRFAQVTGHLVAVHDPTGGGPRYNLAADIRGVSDARAIADVLVPRAQGDNRFGRTARRRCWPPA